MTEHRHPGHPVSHPAGEPPRGLRHGLPGLHVLLHYRREWLRHDLAAGVVLTAILIPVGMGYAEAAGLPAIHGLYATVIPLLVYALFGPSRIMVLGPDSTLAAVIAALILPLAGGSVERAVALAGALAMLSGAVHCCSDLRASVSWRICFPGRSASAF